MARLVGLARERGLALGAHPSFPDRAGFGRAEVRMPPRVLADVVVSQVRALARIAKGAGMLVTHVKPHGALYHAAMRDAYAGGGACDAMIAAMVALKDEAASEGSGVAQRCRLVVQAGPAGAALASRCADAGVGVIAEAFADRAYEPDGSLTPRGELGAVIEEPAAAAGQAMELVCAGRVAARGGGWLAMPAQTLCVHSDSPRALDTLHAVRARFVREQVDVLACP